MREYLIVDKINDSETGKLIEEVRVIYADEEERFKDGEELADKLAEDDYKVIDEVIDEEREYEKEDTDVHRISVIELEG